MDQTETVQDAGQPRKPFDRRLFLRSVAIKAAFTAPLLVAGACDWVVKK